MPVCGPLCSGCSLEDKGTIWIPFDGIGSNKVMLVLDSGWEHEARNIRTMNGKQCGTPLSGPSGHFVGRNLKRLGATRNQFTIANSYWCKAPFLGFTDRPDRFPEAALALDHCRPYLDDLINRTRPKAIVPMGNVALRRITGCSGIERHHAYYMSTPYGIPAIPTFHPSFILKGNAKLSGLWCYAVKRALDVALKAERPKQYDLLLDPPLDEARRYLGTNPHLPLVCDIETPMADDVGEDERDDASYTIVRVSFSNRAGTAISLPWQPPYIDLMREVLGKASEVVFWNQNYDLPRLKHNGCLITGRVIDAMFAWHWLQSDLPKALGFVAPLFVCVEPWKQMASQEPARYSALDSAITMDTYLGIRAQLESEGRWKGFERHCVEMFPILERMSSRGVMLDLEHQGKFKARLEVERDEKLAELQAKVPEEVCDKKVWKRGPKDPSQWPLLRQADDGTYEAPLPFNPGSPNQVKKLILHLGLVVPKAKGEDRESTEAKHLKSLSRKNKIFATILEYRERAKLIDAYMWPVLSDGKVHSTFSFHPSTWRKCVAKGTMIEIVRDVSKRPFGIPVEEVKKGDLAYTFDAEGHMTLRPVLWTGKTGTKKVIRLHWSSMGAHCLGFLDVTPDHLVRLMDGSYKEAQHLRITTGRRKRGPAGDSILALHRGTMTTGYSRLTTAGVPKGWALDHVFINECLTGEKHEIIHHMDRNKLNNRPYNFRGVTRSEHMRIEAYKYNRDARLNHRIMAIEELSEPVDVYDLEVEETHNFVANELCVHNSARNPNVQTVPKRNDLAAEFRRMIVARPGHVLVESDSSAIEAVLVGFFANSQRYIDLAKKGVHKWLASEYAQRPVSKSEPLYDQIKRCVHLFNYMGSPQRVVEEYPNLFASVKDAKKIQDFYFGTPEGGDVKRWHQQVLEQAHKERYLENPWKYRHYFYSVFQYSNGAWVLGDDAKRAVAFLPQSTASAIQTEFVLELERTRPVLREALRWIIHDSIVCEVRAEAALDAARDLQNVMSMSHPLLGGLAVGCECKIGPNLRDMEPVV